MWLKRLIENNQLPKQSNYGTGGSSSGGAGSDLGVGATPLPALPQGLLGKGTGRKQQLDNQNKRLQKRKRMEKQRKWRLSKDQKSPL